MRKKGLLSLILSASSSLLYGANVACVAEHVSEKISFDFVMDSADGSITVGYIDYRGLAYNEFTDFYSANSIQLSIPVRQSLQTTKQVEMVLKVSPISDLVTKTTGNQKVFGSLMVRHPGEQDKEFYLSCQGISSQTQATSTIPWDEWLPIKI